MREELAGFTIGVTADRRRDELAALLERRGARVVLAPALRIVPLSDDTELREATRACLDQPPDILMANTGIGMRGWLEAAEGWGLAEPLRSVLASSYVVARGPKARGAIRAAGLHDQWSPASESCDEVVDHLRRRGVAGQVIAMQLHGERQPECTLALEAAGATVIEVPVYRWAPPTDPAPLHRLIDLIAGRLVDAVTFTSAPAAEALLRAAGDRADAVLSALRGDVLASCVGAVTAEPLLRHGVPVSAPGRARLGALVRTIVDELPRRTVTFKAGGHLLTLRGHAAVIDGELRPLAPAPMAVLRALAQSPGRVLSRTALLRTLPRGADEHAVEMAVARLRAGLRAPRVVQTVVKRGYRLRVD
ncbi:uroporphyrinogen-III synthase [Micromonospora ureilytica]|uniref:Uroporphyrinogen-III synthase n=1 Tax=Micromonospora ureilytica TaxID=709868 RepID=A0ABS0JSY6_9ACTN|nr:uroporphyrinogen-III synthase [Micromonospora ureilytica]MBG6069566.1 uroporphyrinogen-III synthase [Micromonospora ureilytica]WSR57186.1 uroporphyrinogen-III synthase [Micromonospora ureilytica]